MPIVGSNILAGASGQAGTTGADVGTYTGKSLIFNKGSSHKLSKTWSSTETDLDKFTISVWIKRTTLDSGSTQYWMFGAGSPGESNIRIQADKITVHLTGSNYDFTGTRVLRDTSAWYHLVFRYDSDESSAGDRFRCYINGELETWASSSTIPSGTDNQFLDSGVPMEIGNDASDTHDFDGYMAGLNVIDGASLAPTSFGETSDDTGAWVMKDYSGSHGNNGFYFDFSDADGGTVTDNSANSNTFTANNYSSDVDAFYVADTPVNNFCTLNELNEGHGVISNGGITWNGTDGTANFASFGVNKGQWYWECDNSGAAYAAYMGVTGEGYVEANTSSVNNGVFLSYVGANGAYKDYTGTSYTALTAFEAKGVYGFELDADAGRIYYYIDGVLKFIDNTLPSDNTVHFMPFVYATNSGVGGWGAHNYNFGCPMVSGTDQSDANGKGSFEETVLTHHNLISRSSGTAIGNMTAGGNLAASFDGSLRKAYSGCSQTTGNPDDGGFIGKDWGSGQSKTVTRVIVHPTHEYGFVGGASSTYTIDIRGADTAPTGSNYKTHGTQIGSSGGNITDSNAATPYDTLSFGHSVTTTTAYRFHWVVVEPTGGDDDAFISQCEFFESSTNKYLALCSANLPDIEIGQEEDDLAHDYFNTVIYTGNGSSGHSITGMGFSPDLLWIQPRSSGDNGVCFDAVRGSDKQLKLNGNDAEDTHDPARVTLEADGFDLDTTDANYNGNTNTYVSHGWLAGTAFSNDASATGIGTVDSDGQVNTDAGFSIVNYDGTGSVLSWKHGLSSAPDLVLVKNRDQGDSWNVQHSARGGTKVLYLNSTSAEADQDTRWNDTNPTSTVVTIGTIDEMNTSSENYIAYCWHSVDGYSKFGGYEGNNTDVDGTFVYTGFPVGMVIIKGVDTSSNWEIFDNKRSPTNEVNDNLRLDNSNGESTSGGELDFLSNGFKLKTNYGNVNDANTFIYMAFSSGTGFKYANAI